MSSDSNSADSFEDFQSEELDEAYERKSPDSSSYRTAVSEAATSFATCPDPGSSAQSITSDVSVAETLKDEVELGEEVRFDSTSTWQDLEREALSVWIDEKDDGHKTPDKKLIKALKKRDKRKLLTIGSRRTGFVSDAIRRMVWPIVTGMDVIETSARPAVAVIEGHEFYQQVCLDVNRSLKRFPPSVSEIQRSSLQDQLISLIMRILIKNPDFFYYQGFHDIAITFLLVLGEEMAFHVVNNVCQTHLKDFMRQSMDRTSELLEIIPLLIEREDPALGHFLSQSGVGTIFSLSWVITWFSHVLRNYDTVGRLFDFFLTTDAQMPIYLSVCLLLYKSDQIQKLDCDMASVHQYLCRFIEIEEDDLPFERLMHEANDLMQKHPSSQMVPLAEQRHRKNQQLLIASRRKPANKQSILSMIMSLVFKKKGVVTLSLLVLVSAAVFQYIRDPDYFDRFF